MLGPCLFLSFATIGQIPENSFTELGSLPAATAASLTLDVYFFNPAMVGTPQ